MEYEVYFRDVFFSDGGHTGAHQEDHLWTSSVSFLLIIATALVCVYATMCLRGEIRLIVAQTNATWFFY